MVLKQLSRYETQLKPPETYGNPPTKKKIIAGRAAFFAENYKTSLKYLKEAEKDEPNNPTVQYRLGLVCALGLKDFESACKYFERCIFLEPTYTDAHIFLGSILTIRLNDHVNARSHFEKALMIVPNYAECHFLLALLLDLRFQEYQLAWGHIQKSLMFERFEDDLSHDCFELLYKHYYSEKIIEIESLFHGKTLDRIQILSDSLGRHDILLEDVERLLNEDNSIERDLELRNMKILARDRQSFQDRLKKIPAEELIYRKILF